MNTYIGVKQIKARFMPLEDYNATYNKVIPATKGNDGYLVEYEDGYTSWSPKEVFEKAYRVTDGLTFGLAVEALKLGKKVCRSGWNGRGMYVVLQEGSLINPSLARGGAAKCVANAMDDREILVKKIKINPHMSIKNVDDSISTWVPSVNDCLAEDWLILD